MPKFMDNIAHVVTSLLRDPASDRNNEFVALTRPHFQTLFGRKEHFSVHRIQSESLGRYEVDHVLGAPHPIQRHHSRLRWRQYTEKGGRRSRQQRERRICQPPALEYEFASSQCHAYFSFPAEQKVA
jgi:hypothetical protein